MPGSLSHLARRFFAVMRATPLAPGECAEVASWLTPEEARIFFAQPEIDQRHGYEAATVVATESDDPTARTAALLHDAGKRHARLGLIGRTVTSLMIRARLPLTARMRAYRDHGPTVAEELAAIGCAPLVVDFARHHHGSRPAGIPAATWELLQKADQPPKTGRRLSARIT